jgi:Domain of unknown function (DUF222)
MYDDGRRLGCSSADDLLDQIVACEREIAAVQARQLGLIAQFARTRPAQVGEQLRAGASEFAADELGAELRLSRWAASARMELAVTLSERLPGTSAALAAGDIDLPKARAVADITVHLDAPLARAVEARVLPRAVSQTAGQLRVALHRAVLAVDPDGGQVRHERVVVERRVTLSALPDGMAELWALLPAPAASAVYAAIDLRAGRPGHPGDVPVDARRADALVEIVTSHALPAAAMSDGAATATDAARPDAATTRALPPGEAPSGGVPPLAPLVQVTVAATTLLDLDDKPAELAGHGPIPAVLARQIAADPSGTWRRILTDPATGTVLDVGHRSYRPPRPLARYVTARDATCRFPGCRQPARRCDLDHLRPWPDGPTSAANLISLCRHHHRFKHSNRWQVSADRDSTVTWTAPTGRAYTTVPAPLAQPAPLQPAPLQPAPAVVAQPLTALRGGRALSGAPTQDRAALAVVPGVHDRAAGPRLGSWSEPPAT